MANPIVVNTWANDYGLMNALGDATSTSFPSRVPTTAAPTQVAVTGCVIDLVVTGGTNSASNNIILIPVMTANSAAVMTGMRVIAWSKLPKTAPATNTASDLWIPTPLVEVSANAGAVTMVAGATGGALGTTYFFAGVIAAVTTFVAPNANVDYSIINSVTLGIAQLVVDVKGAQKLEVTFDAGANVTAMNCLYKRL